MPPIGIYAICFGVMLGSRSASTSTATTRPGSVTSAAPRSSSAAPSARPARTDSSTRKDDMKLRRLGDSDLEVSEISLGSWLTYSGGVERDQTEACTRAAFDAGINFFDTANVYGTGASETAWGEILSGLRPRLLHPRDQGLLPDVGDRLGASLPSRSRSRSTHRSSGCRPTTSTSTSATASTPRRRSRRRWRR